MDTTCKLVIVDGLIHCGRSTLTRALAEDLGIMPLYNGLPGKDAYTVLRGQLDNPEPLVVDTFHLSAAAYMRGTGPFETDLSPEQWQLLDDALARRFARIVYLVDTPGNVEKRLRANATGTTWTRERLGERLRHLTKAFEASVTRKGSYLLTQFIDPTTGEQTAQYERLLTTIRREMRLDEA